MMQIRGVLFTETEAGRYARHMPIYPISTQLVGPYPSRFKKLLVSWADMHVNDLLGMFDKTRKLLPEVSRFLKGNDCSALHGGSSSQNMEAYVEL